MVVSELEDKISNILSNPDELVKITNMARSLMDSGAILPPDSSEQGIDASLSPMLKSLMSNVGSMGDLGSLFGGGGVSKSDKTALLAAICPYLEKSRGDKLERAIKIAKMAKIARMFMKERRGEESGD